MPALPLPRLDHVIVNARDHLDAMAERWRRLGFQLTPKGFHTLGSVNHLAIFGTNYLELLGVDPGEDRTDVMAWPAGLNGVAFQGGDAAETYAALSGAGVPVEAPLGFSRPVSFEGGQGDAAFHVVRVPRDMVAAGRVFFCSHLTPELVWRPEWQAHPNGVTDITAVLVCTEHPAGFGGVMQRLFGTDAVQCRPNDAVLDAGGVRIEAATPALLSDRFANALPGAAGRTEWMAALSFRTASLDQTAAALHAGGIALRREPDRILVPAAEAGDVALEFRAAV